MKSETMPKKKKSYLSRLGMTLLTILLIVLFIFIMSLVSKIQGTARVVNYAGLVRGKTQRIIKLEISGSPQDEMIADIDAFIDGLENGSSQLNLVRLDDPDFQAKMKELDAYFSQLKEEVAQVRMRDYRKTDIIAKSERLLPEKGHTVKPVGKDRICGYCRPSYPDRCRAGKTPSVCCFKPPAPKQGIFRRSHRPSQQK